jgi:uncharacterized protein (UPF0332 family)
VKPEQTALIVKAKSSIKAAHLLADDGYFDFSVSRAYYAMFYLAEALLLEENLTFSKHSAVISAFGRLFAKTGRMSAELHRYLIEGASSRNVGDYDAGPSLSGDDANEQLGRAEEFLKATEQLLLPTGSD